MRYIKSTVFVCLALSFIIENVSGQSNNRDDAGSRLYSQNAASSHYSPAKNYGQQSTDHQGVSVSSKESDQPAQPMADSASTDSTAWINVAYGKIEQRDKTGAISVLNPGDYINEDYTSSSSGGIFGRVGGMLNSNLIWGLDGALVMIDGIPRRFSDIRLDEVKQVTVLKGVNAVALYGSRAANGVILITSKRGSSKKEMNVRVNAGLASPISYPKFLGSADYMTLYNEARANDGLDTVFSPSLIDNYRSGNNPYRYPDINYYTSKYLKNYVNSTDLDAEFSGGNRDAKFYANIGWMNNSLNLGEGANEKDTRFNARGNVDLRINDYVSSSIDVSTVVYNSRRALGDFWGSAATILPYKYSPLLPVSMINPDSVNAVSLAENSRNIIDGKYVFGGTQEYLTNPIADLYAGGYATTVNRALLLTNSIDIDLNSVAEGLSFHTVFNADYNNEYVQSVNNDYSVYTPVWDSVPGSDIIESLDKFGSDVRTGTQYARGANSMQIKDLGFSIFFNYLRSFSGVHNISATLVGNGTSINTGGITQPATNANIGLRFDYNYKHKYWVDFSGSAVNSTKLPAKTRKAFSPTLSLSWLASAEDFLSGSSNIDLLKLSVSAGILNTDLLIGDYFLYDNTLISQNYFGWNDTYSNRATVSLQGSNPDLSFAKRKEINATIDGSFFKHLISLEASFFIKRMADIPTQRFSQYPSYYTDFVPYTNYNSYQYTGLDLMVNFDKRIGDLVFDLGVNGIYLKSKFVKWDQIYTYSYQNLEGKPVDAIFGLVSNGFFQDQSDIDNSPKQQFGEVKPGDIKYVDQNGDGIIDANDQIQIGHGLPPLVYSVNFSVTYKSLTLFVQGTGTKGGDAIKSGDYYWVDGDNKYSEVVFDRWTEATKNTATYPRLSSQQNNNNYRSSDFWMYKTDQFIVSHVQLTYNISRKILGNSFVKGLGIYVDGSDLLTISKNKDILDLNVGTSPQMRYYSAGVKASF